MSAKKEGIDMATNAIQPQGEVRLARPLKVLVPLIEKDIAAIAAAREAAVQAAVQAAEEDAKPHYLSTGEKLWEASVHFPKNRNSAPGSEFYEWAERTFRVEEQTIRRWMKYAEEHGGEPAYFLEDTRVSRATETQAKKYPTLSSVIDKRDPGHRPAWHKPVQQITNQINFKALADEQQEKKKEEKLCHDLGIQLIDIGYKVLAAKLHPDKVSEKDKPKAQRAMARLNKVRNILRGAI